MSVRCQRSVINLLLLGTLALAACGQKGPLYLTDEMKQEPEPLELSEQDLQDLQEELQEQPQSPRRTT